MEIYNRIRYRWSTYLIFLLASTSVGCGDSENTGRKVSGSVKDINGNAYPKTVVKVSNGLEMLETATNSSGVFELATKDIGIYDIVIVTPLATTLVSPIPTTVEIKDDIVSTVNFVVQPTPLAPYVVIEDADIFNEIKDVDGNVPNAPGDLIYARNVFDAPIGLLTAIKAPDAHHVSLMEWETAFGNVTVTCNGNSSTINLFLQGLIPNGTYTFWCNFLNSKKGVGESVSLGSDISRIEPLGSGTQNIAIADANGTINTTIHHGACILTETPGLVIPVIYHINGNTYGADHIPDEEEVSHLLIYFQ